MAEDYPFGLLVRLLWHWPLLRHGWYPHDGHRPEGYRGHHRGDMAPFEPAAIAAADIALAVMRLPKHVRREIVLRFWYGRRTEMPWNELAYMVWKEINR